MLSTPVNCPAQENHNELSKSTLLQGYIAFEIYQYVVCSTTKEQSRQVQNRRSDTDQRSRKII